MKAAQPDKTNRIIEILNIARSLELHAIHQYMNQHFTLDDMDYGTLAGNVKRISIDEMDHAEKFAERIKTLGGQPTHDLGEEIVKGQDLKDIFPYDMNLETTTMATYNKFVAVCREHGDNISADLFQDILEEEQEHFDYFDNSNNHLTQLGPAFLALVAGSDDDTGESTLGFAGK